MRTVPVPDLLLAAAAAAALMFAAARTRAALADTRSPQTPVAPPAPVRSEIAVSRGVGFQRSPFRIGRVAQHAAGDAAVGTLDAPPAIPEIGVRAIVGGPPWRAVLTGLPGTPSPRVVQLGERFDPVRVVAIEADRVRLVAGDSTWVVLLPGRRP